MGRNRTKNKRMPKGWTPIGNAVYFVPTNAADLAIVQRATGAMMVNGALEGGRKSLRLGALADHNECATTYAEKIVAARAVRDEAEPGTIGELVFMAFRDILPTIEHPGTKADRKRHWNALKEGWGKKPYARSAHECALDPFKFFSSLDVQAHIDGCSETRPVSVNREVDSWTIIFDWARTRWGRTNYNPCAGVDKNPEESRDVLPVHDHIYKGSKVDEETGQLTRGIYRQISPSLRFIINMYRYYGRRRGETLRLTLSDMRHEDGIHMLRGKERQRPRSAKKGPRKPRVLIIPWDTRNRRMVARYMLWRTAKVREGLPVTAFLVNRDGMPYTKEAAKSEWRRGMQRSGQTGTFNLHDIRALRADTLPEDVAINVLAHDTPDMVRKVYRNRGPHVVNLKGHK